MWPAGDLLAVDTGNPGTLWVVESEALKTLVPSTEFISPPRCPITAVTQLRVGTQYTGTPCRCCGTGAAVQGLQNRCFMQVCCLSLPSGLLGLMHTRAKMRSLALMLNLCVSCPCLHAGLAIGFLSNVSGQRHCLAGLRKHSVQASHAPAAVIGCHTFRLVCAAPAPTHSLQKLQVVKPQKLRQAVTSYQLQRA